MNETLDLTSHWVGGMAIAIFIFAYVLVILEEKTHMRKSKPVLIAAGLIWIPIALVYSQNNLNHAVEEAVRHNFLEYSEVFLFLFAAMTYINALIERNVFDALRSWLIRQGWSFRRMFWLTGLLAFCISPVADNLTTALLMGAVVLAVGKNNAEFVALGCINIVVAANAGGVFSPFGDITTLMVWQKGVVSFETFFKLFLPALLNWIIPALIMSFAVPKIQAGGANELPVAMRKGALTIMFLFFCTIVTAVTFHAKLHLPPAMGMMFGLGLLMVYAYWLKKTKEITYLTHFSDPIDDAGPYDIFKKVERAEWDTLLFFYGIIMCVGGIKFIGYLDLLSAFAYDGYGPTVANVSVGLLSALIDNIPVMFAVLSMMPDMSQGQWLLVTLTTGVGGSLLSIGSAAGVALMGASKGKYTFKTHLKWIWAIALGYVVSIYTHMYINSSMF